MPTRVYLMRHAETCDPDLFHGYESDTDLSPFGYRQAAAVAPVLASRRPDVVISSGMLRARRTAEPIARACGLPLLIEPALHERKVGKLTGTPTNKEIGLWPETLDRWLAGDTAYGPEGSESYDDLVRRILPAWERVTSAHAGRTVVLVCHGIVCRVLLLAAAPFAGLADWRKLGRVANVSVSELEQGAGGRWRALTVAEVPQEVRELPREG
jgi:probable phosphoglycerate mutase